MNFSISDHEFMTRALRLAERGLTTTTPNPRVGCVIAKDGQVLGEGWHQRAGEPHAEIHALQQSGASARGATAYVTLEPCSHFGRTPPCADALINAGIARVVVSLRDPNPLVAGEGLARLRVAGVEVGSGLMESEALALNIGFIARMTRGRPWLRLKIACSLDGKTALLNGQSQWLTGQAARQDVHQWRARSCAILTGSGTVLADNPSLTVRDVPCSRQPLRVVVDSRLRTPPDAKILQGGNTLIFSAQESQLNHVEVIAHPNLAQQVDLSAMLHDLARRGINEVLVEAGQRLNGALLAAGLVDELLIYQAPFIVGDKAMGMFGLPELTDLSAKRELRIIDARRIGADMRYTARPGKRCA